MGLDRIQGLKGDGSPGMIDFFRRHDLAFRIRRLRLLARRVTQEWQQEADVSEAQRDKAREAIYAALALYLDREPVAAMGKGFPALAAAVFTDPGAAVDHVETIRSLSEIDGQVDVLLAEALSEMPQVLRRRVLLAYLGFPFYDTVTLPLLRGEGLTEFDPIRVDRISPEDCHMIRKGPVLRGTEFFNFGAFFSRAYRENDYLWGRLHGAERMIDLISSTAEGEHALLEGELWTFKHEAFLAVLEEEQERLTADPSLVQAVRNEVLRGG
jgi:hypothetical protein